MSFNAKKVLLAGSAFLALTAYGTAANAQCATTGAIVADCDLESSTTGAITLDSAKTVTITKSVTIGHTIDGDGDDTPDGDLITSGAVTVTQTADIGVTEALETVTVDDGATWNVDGVSIIANNILVGSGTSGILSLDGTDAAVTITDLDDGVIDVADGGRINVTDSTNTVTVSDLLLGDGAVLNVADTNDFDHGTIDGAVAGQGTLILAGSHATDAAIGGTNALELISLTGAQTFSVGHTVKATDITGNAAAQKIDITGAVTITGDIDLAGGADVLEFTNSATIAGTVAGVNTVTVEDGKTATFTGTSLSGTPAISLGNGSAIVFNNGAGTFTGTVTGDANANTFTLTDGTFTGNMNLGNGANVVTLTAGTLGASGNTITGGDDVDDINLNGGTLNSNLSLGLGADTVDVGGTVTVNGNIVGGDGANTLINKGALTIKGAVSGFTQISVDGGKTLTLNGSGKTYDFNVVEVDAGENQDINLVNGKLTGDINLGAGTNNFAVTGGTFTGAYTGGAGADTVTVNLANATDTFNFEDTFAVAGGANVLTITKGTVRFNGDWTSTDTNATFAADSNVTINSDIDLGAGDYTQEAAVTFVLHNDTAGNFGTLAYTGARTLTNKVLNISVASDAAIGDGDTFQILTTGDADVEGALFTLNGLSPNSLLSFEADAVADGDLVLTATVNSLSDVVAGAGSKSYLGGVGNTFDGLNATILAGTADADITAAYGNMQGASSDEELSNVVESVVPVIDGSSIATVVDVGSQVSGLVDTRLASLRGDGTSGVAAGDMGGNGKLWIQGFGRTATQDDRDGIDGYDADTFGGAIGIDSDNMLDNATVGVALSYANTEADGDAGFGSETDIDSYQVSLYGEFDVAPATFVNGMVGYARNNIEQDRFNVGGTGQTASADYDSDQFMARVSTGRDYETGYGFKFTPQVLANYVHVSTDSYSETGAGGLSLTNVDVDDVNIFELGVAADLTWDVANNDGSMLQPKLHFGYRYDLIGDEVEASSTFTGGGAAFNTQGADPAQGTFDVGAGVTYFSNDNWDLRADYNFEAKEDYDAHAGLVRASFKF
ncbi:MAG: autotransporter domain-containing protein [Alphaproteobacteria bacterium]|nr:autotransporter domain-containing protein [Alphaproteobacteria bacterium]